MSSPEAATNNVRAPPSTPLLLRYFGAREPSSCALVYGQPQVGVPKAHNLDLLGRSDRHVARVRVAFFEPGHAKWDWDYVVDEARPDVILFASRGLAQREDFRAQYLRVMVPSPAGWPEGVSAEFYLHRDARAALLDRTAELRPLAPPGMGSADPTPAETLSRLEALG